MSAVEFDPVRQASQLISAGQFEQAETVLQKLLDEAGEDGQVLILLGLCRHGVNDASGALAYFDRAVQADDNNPLAHYYRGRILSSFGSLDDARESLAQALALNPNFVEALTIMGSLSMQQGQLSQAVSELRTALRAKQDYVPALSVLARALAMQDELEEAEKTAGQAVKLNPENAVAQEAMAFVFLKQGRVDFAEQCLRNALKQQPGNGELHVALASILAQRSRHQEALPHFREALARNIGGAGTALNASVSLARSGEPQQAWQLLEQAYQRWPENPDLRLKLAEYRLSGGQPESAFQLIENMDSERFGVRTLFVRAYHAMGQTNEAMAELDRMIESDQADQARFARLLKVDLAAQNKDLPLAEQAIEPLLKQRPPDAEAVQIWLGACRRLNCLELAIDPVQRVLDETDFDEAATGDQARLHQLLAELNDQLDRPEQALRHLGRTGWRPAPIAALMEQQQQNNALQIWANHAEDASALKAPEDGLPAPIIIGGWPGSGRSLILAALYEAADQMIVLDPEQLESRREALGLPALPDMLLGRHESNQLSSRKRYMRSLDRNRMPKPVLDTGWYEMSAIPALAYNFPGLTVIWPEFDPRDLELHFRFSGYQDVPMLREQLTQELALAKQLSQQLPVNVIRVRRQDLFDAPQAVIDAIAERIGIEAVPAMRTRLEMLRESEAMLPDGRWEAYRPLFDLDANKA